MTKMMFAEDLPYGPSVHVCSPILSILSREIFGQIVAKPSTPTLSSGHRDNELRPGESRPVVD